MHKLGSVIGKAKFNYVICYRKVAVLRIESKYYE